MSPFLTGAMLFAEGVSIGIYLQRNGHIDTIKDKVGKGFKRVKLAVENKLQKKDFIEAQILKETLCKS